MKASEECIERYRQAVAHAEGMRELGMPREKQLELLVELRGNRDLLKRVEAEGTEAVKKVVLATLGIFWEAMMRKVIHADRPEKV
jgi:hypothetical protein